MTGTRTFVYAVVLLTGGTTLGPPQRAISSNGAPAPRCVVDLAKATPPVRVTDASRRECERGARLVEPHPPVVSPANLREGLPGEALFSATTRAFCRLRPRAKDGGSLKFRCFRTNEANQLYDDKGTLVTSAAGFDAQGVLLDASGARLLDASGDPIEGDELRVKYFRGNHPEPRYREMFTESVTSRLFWALGIPVDLVYMPAAVVCFGCNRDPFGQLTALPSPATQEFTFASVERPYDGKTIGVPRRSGFMSLGGRYDHGWSFAVVTRNDAPMRLHAEVLAIALNIVGYNNFHSYQNDLICRRGAWDKATGVCSDAVAYVADVGGTLGGSKRVAMKGDSAQPTKHPRGDFVTFSAASVFREPRACRLHYKVGEIERVSEAARQIVADRIRGRLGREEVRIIAARANLHRMDRRVNQLLAAQNELTPGRDLDQAVQYLWADEITSRLEEVLTARCA